ncbi:MAG: GNAT family N-acetyltransferase [Comamonadaceae bacterium]|nr:MAG: GNAT family N-acetyltransferase [Comamonadaceae bacterium]
MNPQPATALEEAPAHASLAGRYPTALIDVRMLPDQQRLVLRPILPQDDHLLADLINRVTPITRQRRFPSATAQVTVDQLARLTRIDHRRHMAVVVTTWQNGQETLLAEGRLLIDEQSRAEFTLMVDDAWQRLGVGTWVLQALGQAAEAQGVEWLWCDVLASNETLLALARHCRFGCIADRIDPRIVRVETRPRTLQVRRLRLLPATRLGWMPRWWPRVPQLTPVRPFISG